MLMPTPSLQDFIDPVAVCQQTAGLETVLEIFNREKCDRLVVVSAEQFPLGLLNLRSLLPYLLSSRSQKSRNREGQKKARSPKSSSPDLTSSFSLQPPRSLLGTHRQDACATQSHIELPPIEPLTTLPEKLSLNRFRLYLQTQPTSATVPHYALVDISGKFLGLLDRLRLLKFLATNSTTFLAKTELADGRDALPHKGMDTKDWELGNQGAEFLDTYTNMPLQSSERQDSLPSVPGKLTSPLPQVLAPSLSTLNLLIQLLEQLPLPLSLQSGEEQVISQNLTWRQQFGDGPEPNAQFKIQSSEETLLTPKLARAPTGLEEAADIQPCYGPTDTPCVAARIAAGRVTTIPTDPSARPISYSANRELWEMPTGQTKRVQDRLWQFTKLPLGQGLGMSNWEESLVPNPDEAAILSPLYLVLAQDVTEQQQVAKELAAKNADLIQLNRFKDEFLACISHELKTPLTAVLGLSSLLKDQVIGDLNERQLRYSQLIYQSGRQLMMVVNDILDLTRMETGQLELTLEPLNIRTVCDRAYSQALQQRSPLAQAKSPNQGPQSEQSGEPETRFTLHIEPSLEMLVADEMRLRQMLVNLLSNALKFTEVGGEIGLKVNRWDGWIAFNVWDTGIGIPEQKQHLIFQKFQQLENPLTRQFEGTGLGLVLTQRLARLHGGDVSFISKIGQGSQFTLLLPPLPPRSAQERQSANAALLPDSLTFLGNSAFIPHAAAYDRFASLMSPAKPLALGDRNQLVLIIEAVPKYIEQLTDQLTNLGYRVIIARSGTEAIEKARRLQPGIILLNPCLPLLSGWDVLTLLKSDVQSSHIPVVVTSTSAEKELAYQNRADGFLSLPVQEQALAQSLHQLRKEQPSPAVKIAILHLTSGISETSSSLLTLSRPRFAADYRVLEADDLEQAELLSRVWHLDVILLEGNGLTDPLAYLRDLSQFPTLASLPLVTLDRRMTEAANQVAGLSVFPCLAIPGKQSDAALFQVIQVAAGISCKPQILVVDATALKSDWSGEDEELKDTPPQDSTLSPPYAQDWLQALIQYLETAGFRSFLSRSWREILQQLQHQSVDLLVIHLEAVKPERSLVDALKFLAQIPFRPPVLVLDRRQKDVSADRSGSEDSQLNSELDLVLSTFASRILCGSTQSMTELLDGINQILAICSVTA